MTGPASLKYTCPKCGASDSVALDTTWKAVSTETVTKKKLFGTSRSSEIVWEKEIECPNCHASSTGHLTTHMPLG
jgi:hypothetical protein